jgi:hypothetical protein
MHSRRIRDVQVAARGLIAQSVVMGSCLTGFAEVDRGCAIQDTASIQLWIVKRLPLRNRWTDCSSSLEDLNTACIALTFRPVLQPHVVSKSVDDAAVSWRYCAGEDQSLLSFSVLKQHKLIIISKSRRIIQIDFYLC